MMPLYPMCTDVRGKTRRLANNARIDQIPDGLPATPQESIGGIPDQ